jgi:glycosyltransferase involved in cell wall biosynthesis
MTGANHSFDRLQVLSDGDAAPRNPCGLFQEVVANSPAEERCAENVRAYRPDCIRAAANGATLAVELGRELGVPTIIDDDAHPGALRLAGCVLARNEFRAAGCIARGADPAKVVTLHERVDRALFSPEGDSAPGGGGHPRLLSVQHDNFDRVLQACALVAVKHPDLKLVVLGELDRTLPGFAECRSGATEQELARWLRWADTLVLPSLGDPGPAPAQALACGTPCIVSKLEVTREFVTDRWDGLLVDPTDVGDIANAIEQIADPGVQARLAAPARTASERFDAASIDRREAGIYRWLLRTQSPLVSVVLPTYNRQELIAEAVENVLAQDYPEIELIVVNDGSTDETRAELDKLEARLQDARLRVIHQANQGLPRALNSGFADASGSYWTWTSDDNRYRPGALQAMVRELELQPEAGLVYADMVKHLQSGQAREVRMGPPEGLPEGCVVGACFLYRASVARAVGDYDPDFFLAEDYDYWLRMRRHTSLMWLRRVLYDYADTPGSLSRKYFIEAQRARLKVLEREFGGAPDWLARKFARLCADASDSKNEGLGLSAVRSALRAIRMRPGSITGWRTLGRALTPGPLLRLTRRMRGLDDG